MRYINIKSLLKIAGLILIIVSIAFLFCIPAALIYSEPVKPFVYSILICLIPGLLIYFFIPSSINEKVSVKEGYLSVTLGWLILTLAGALPYLLSKSIPGFINAFFESMSGFTTTGATILRDVESMPKSILLWRSMTHWIGGVGVILLVILILPTLKVGGYNLFSLESSMKQKILPKTRSIASTILLIYLGLTLLEVILLSLGGMNLFDSLCHTFGTVATGGFSTKNTSITRYSPYIQYVIGVFMFLAAVSYIVFYFIVKGQFRKVMNYEELWFYIFFITGAVVVTTLILYIGTERNFALSFRHGFFQAVSHVTGTGFATTDYMLWPSIGWFFMFILMPVGGCTGSTAGGIKMARHLIVLRNLKTVFRRFQHQNAVIPIKLNDRIIPDNINKTMLAFVPLYILITIAGMIVMQLSGISVMEAAGASTSAISNVGPGLGASGNFGHYNDFNEIAKVTMIFLMLIGRLEIFTIIALFTRSFWKN
ncbi:MAG TPA: TrkH family potassium uptake protein [Bacteroidales bacterium]|nr:TrkH family potassium uptake protein [Bacteroidales bacterium]